MTRSAMRGLTSMLIGKDLSPVLRLIEKLRRDRYFGLHLK
jgi:hypothetical protein